MADVKVTFAFVTPRSINCCAAAQCNDESTVDVSETLSGAPQHDLRAAIIKVLDYDTGHSRVFCMTQVTTFRMCSSARKLQRLVNVPGASITKDGICSSLCALLRMGLECERYLRSCALFCCTVERKSIVLRDPFHDGGCPSQVAIIYGAVDVGDVVLVSAALPCAAVEARPSVLQAVVVRRFAEDGVTLYDVKEVDTAVVLEGLTCTQLVPL
ncbi:hypothetical protein CGC21_17680 [Leishmania donovani]|uniref:Uncharacterized protein n=1 Tax=Leishmania donovani TaxID=5661 RepID=A0A504XP36_LEIDO|nr:hypothetical protein CGC21_17680 [Leishmania donovani]